MWLLINNMHEKIRDVSAEETHAYHAIGKKLRHKIASSKARAWFESKRFDWFFQKPYCLLANHNPEFRCVICTGITLFALVLHVFAVVLHILHSFLSQSESSNFFVYIVIIIIIITIIVIIVVVIIIINFYLVILNCSCDWPKQSKSFAIGLEIFPGSAGQVALSNPVLTGKLSNRVV